MSSEWPTMQLGDLAQNISRPFNFKGRKNVIFVNTGDVLEGHFLHADYSEVSGLPGQAKKKIEKGDILYSEIRPGNKRYVYVDFDPTDYVVSTKFMVVKANESILPEYLYIVLTSEQCEQEFKMIAESRSGTFPQITFDSVDYYPIQVPPLEIQAQIVSIVGSIDNKFNLNRQINQTLEQIAQTIFKSWFVDFEPVKAKIEAKAAGRDPERAAMCAISGKLEPELDQLSPEQYQQLAATAALFPDGLVESELGLIPVGWEVGTVDEEFDLTMGQSPPGNTYNESHEGLPFYQGRTDFGFRFPTQRIFCTAPTRFADVGDTLVSVRAPVGDINMATERCCIGRGVAAARHKSKNRSYTYYFMQSIEEVFARFEGEGTVFGSISKKDFHNIQSVKPKEKAVIEFERLALPCDEIIFNNEIESRNLSLLRDSLLPKLLSGELCYDCASNATVAV